MAIYYSSADSKNYENFNVFADPDASAKVRRSAPMQMDSRVTSEWTLITKLGSSRN